MYILKGTVRLQISMAAQNDKKYRITTLNVQEKKDT